MDTVENPDVFGRLLSIRSELRGMVVDSDSLTRKLVGAKPTDQGGAKVPECSPTLRSLIADIALCTSQLGKQLGEQHNIMGNPTPSVAGAQERSYA